MNEMSGETSLQIISHDGFNQEVRHPKPLNQVQSQADFEVCGRHLVELSNNQKIIDDFFDPLIESAHKQHKMLLQKKKDVMIPVTNLQTQIKTMMNDFIQSERKRQEEEQKRLIEEARRAAEEAKKELEAKALKAIESHEEDKADLFLQEAESVKPILPVAQPIQPKVEGVRIKTYYRFEITNPDLVPETIEVAGVKYIVKKIDESTLTELSKLTKGQGQIPGVRFFSEQRTEVSGR